LIISTGYFLQKVFSEENQEIVWSLFFLNYNNLKRKPAIAMLNSWGKTAKKEQRKKFAKTMLYPAKKRAGSLLLENKIVKVIDGNRIKLVALRKSSQL
jgi:hypothetical protein